ncbi:SpoIIE family protein phosphatase [Actinotalea sp. AC32]|nr:SpoIIE family protein phosphatase [Actinotalea sp. AC32]
MGAELLPGPRRRVGDGHRDNGRRRRRDPPVRERPGIDRLCPGIDRRPARRAGARSTLAPGDSLVLYTDGITEARAVRPVRADDEGRPHGAPVTLFGEARLRAVLAETAATRATPATGAATDHGRADLLARGIDEAVQVFAAGGLRDDVTLLVLHVPEGQGQPT